MFSKAPWAGAFKSQDEKVMEGDEEGESLVTVLDTAEDRSALTALVADCAAVMRQAIIDVFDPEQTGKKLDLVAELSDDENLANSDINPSTVDLAAQDTIKKERQQKEEQMRKDLAQRRKELSGPKMQDLKSAALKHFDEWRDSVTQRVGEIVNSEETAQAQANQAQPKQSSQIRTTSSRRQPEQPKYDSGVDETMKRLYSPIESTLTSLPEEKRALVLHSVLLLLLSLEHYHAYSRTLLVHLSTSLDLNISFLARDESKIARGLLAAAENMDAEEEKKKRAEEGSDSRKWKVGLATVAGAALIGVTGGLAAPLLAAGVGSVMGGLGLGATAAAGYLGTLAGSGVLVGGLFGAYGGRMTGKMMDQYARQVEDFAFIPIKTHHKPRKIEKEYRRLRVAVGISGWVTSKNDVISPWKVIGTGMESFALQWEVEALMNLGNALMGMVTTAAWSYLKSEIISRTVFSALTAGLWPLGLLKIGRVLDNPWSIASYRAQKAGEVLADALINRAQGERPVTLIGYSLGAKVIYTCLQVLAERRAFGLIESVVLIGSPTPSDAADWRRIRTVVSGRVVNVYSTKDYILAYLYRSSSIQLGVAGLQGIENVKGIENVDVSELVTGHTSYRLLTGSILHKIGFEDVDEEQLKEEQEARTVEETREEEQREGSEQAEAANKLSKSDAAETTPKGATGIGKDASLGSKPTVDTSHEVTDEDVKDLEKQIQKKNEQSYMGWAQEKMTAAGASATEAYEKAKIQWQLRRNGSGHQTATDAAAPPETSSSDARAAARAASAATTPGANSSALAATESRSSGEARAEASKGA